jgi:hypothetical protein
MNHSKSRAGIPAPFKQLPCRPQRAIAMTVLFVVTIPTA